MVKKRSRLLRVSGLLLAIAPVILFKTNSLVMSGEPNIPKKNEN